MTKNPDPNNIIDKTFVGLINPRRVEPLGETQGPRPGAALIQAVTDKFNQNIPFPDPEPEPDKSASAQLDKLNSMPTVERAPLDLPLLNNKDRKIRYIGEDPDEELSAKTD